MLRVSDGTLILSLEGGERGAGTNMTKHPVKYPLIDIRNLQCVCYVDAGLSKHLNQIWIAL
jgi:hypothetical protein